MKDLNYGIIGCGMMGHEHIENIGILSGARVHAIYEPDDAMRGSAMKRVPDAISVGSIDEMLAIEALDALVIVTPNFMHADQLRQITTARTIPILIEKPLVTDPDDYAFIEGLQQTYGAPIWVAMEYRYMPPLQKFLEMMDDATGGVKHFTIKEHRFPFLPKVENWNRFNKLSGGTLVEKCCHFFDLMRLAIPGEPKRVTGSGWQAVNHVHEIYNGEKSDIWDAAFAIVDFDSGARAMLDLCMFAEGAEYQEEITAVGHKGRIDVLIPGPVRFWPLEKSDPPTPKVVIQPRNKSGRQVVEVEVPADLLAAGDHNGSTYYQHLKFRDAVRGNAPVEVTLHDGLWAVRMGWAAQEASRTGQSFVF
ncbi:MAG: Gfo/Idh/MocA family oxidoreductase [Pseudomonadota bacterium]